MIGLEITGKHGYFLLYLLYFGSWQNRFGQLSRLYIKKNHFPSGADFFYLAGLQFYFVFAILYLKPFKNAISKKLIVSTSIFAMAVLIPNLYMTFENNSAETQFAIILGAIYPIADAIVLVPSIIGIILFFR